MKITEKIVTSVTPPQLINVAWHNPETGELKMFGNKGWEVVGGKPGDDSGDSDSLCSGTCEGYPIVNVATGVITLIPNTYVKSTTIHDSTTILQRYDVEAVKKLVNFGMEQLCGTSYLPITTNYKLLTDTPVLFNLDITRYLEEDIEVGLNTAANLCSPCWIFEVELLDEAYGLFLEFLGISSKNMYAIFGGYLMNITFAGFTDKNPLTDTPNIILPINDYPVPCYFKSQRFLNSDNLALLKIPFLGVITCAITETKTVEYFGSTVCVEILDSPMIDLLVYIAPSERLFGLLIDPHTNTYLDVVTMMINPETNELMIDSMDLGADAILDTHISLKSIKGTKEYIFDGIFNEVAFSFPIQWTNDNPPTFDGTTRHVISILDGVGCYTVTPIEETT